MMKTDIKTDDNNNFILTPNGDLEVYTAENVNIFALRNILNANKMLFIEKKLSSDDINKFILSECFRLKLNPLEIKLDYDEYEKGNLKIIYKLDGE